MRLLRALEWIVACLAALQCIQVGAAMAARVTFPGDLEWMEGATLLGAMRVRDGLPLYVAPSLDWIPFIYPPLHPWILGTLSQLVPLGYTLGRVVSIVAFVGSCLALAWAARNEGARWGLVAGVVGLYVGTWENAGTFYDLVRTDSLSMALLGFALVLGARDSLRAAIASGLLLAVAFTSKQHAAMFGFVIAGSLWWRFGWRRAAVFGAASAGPALAFTLAMSAATDGLFVRYLVEVPAYHGMASDRLFPGAQKELWQSAPITATAALLAGAWIVRRPYWAGVSAMALVVVTLMRGHTGGYLNVLIPMFWAMSLWPVLALSSVRWAWAPHLTCVLVAAQLYQGRPVVDRYLPKNDDAAQIAALIEDLRTLPEPVLMPHAPWYPVLAGKEPSFALITLWDIDHDGGPFHPHVKQFRAAMRAHHWASIVLPDERLGHGLKDFYRRDRALKARPVATKTGWPVRLRGVWVPKELSTP